MRRPRLSDELCQEIDARRGGVPFETFVRELLRSALDAKVPPAKAKPPDSPKDPPPPPVIARRPNWK